MAHDELSDAKRQCFACLLAHTLCPVHRVERIGRMVWMGVKWREVLCLSYHSSVRPRCIASRVSIIRRKWKRKMEIE